MMFRLAVLILTLHFSTFSANSAQCVFYGSPGEVGSRTANGEFFDPMGNTCTAPAHIPFGTRLEVTNLRNGRSITVRVNDRFGAPPKEDKLDLAFGAFGKLATHAEGVIPCKYRLV